MYIKSLFVAREYERLVQCVDFDACEDRDILSLAILADLYTIQKYDIGAQLPQSGSQNQKGRPTLPDNERELSRLIETVEKIQSRFSNDGTINYLLALVLRHRQHKSDISYMVELWIRSIKQAPYNWSAWRELAMIEASVSPDNDAYLRQLELYPFYRLERLFYLKKYKSILSEISVMGKIEWNYLDELEGSCQHELRDFTAASVSFERIRKRDKFYIRGMDEYSNCLFVLERESDLSQLASHVCQIDLHSPCLLVASSESKLDGNQCNSGKSILAQRGSRKCSVILQASDYCRARKHKCMAPAWA